MVSTGTDAFLLKLIEQVVEDSFRNELNTSTHPFCLPDIADHMPFDIDGGRVALMLVPKTAIFGYRSQKIRLDVFFASVTRA